MNSHLTLRISALLAVMLLVGGRAQAADLTAFVGGVKPGTLSLSGIRRPLDSGPVFGLRLASDFVPMLGHEHTLAFSSDYLFPSGARDITSAKGFVYNSNLIVNVPAGRTVPYVTAGLGLIHQYGSANLPVGTRFAVNYGGGLKFPKLFGPLGLRFDARGYTATGISGSKLNLLELTVGLLLSFGR